MGFPSISVRSMRSKITSNNNSNNNKNSKSKKSSRRSSSDGSSHDRRERSGIPPSSPSKRSSLSSSFSSTSTSLRIRTNSLMSSLGTGILGHDGSVSFVPSPTARNSISNIFSSPASTTTSTTTENTTKSGAVSMVLRRSCSFLRVSDLEMEDDSVATMSVTSDFSYTNNNNDQQQQQQQSQQHTHRPVVDPPPGIEIDPKERWIALCTTSNHGGNGKNDLSSKSNDSEHTPIAPVAIDKLANFGIVTVLDESMWQPDSKSEKLIKKAGSGSGSSDSEWIKHTFQKGKMPSSSCSIPSSKDILVWSGSFTHGLYGSEVPAIRSVGIVDTSARKLMELLVDSSRVKEYNKISLGREDIIKFDGNLETGGPFGKSITKVMKSETKPPLIKPLALTTILHAKQMPDESGYLIVSRGVHRPDEEVVSSGLKSEIVIGVNLIVDFDDDDHDRCLMINVNHIFSPMVPLYIAKRVATSSAHGFMNDIRACV
jgi:hypothetical protein